MVHPILIIGLYGEGVKNMKLNKKIIIPAFTLLVGTALAGSVSSTVAWYQYSTKANVAYIGTSAGTIGNLKLRIYEGGTQADNEGWKTYLSYQDVETYLQGKKIKPITTGKMGRDEKLPQFYSNPVAGNGPLSMWNTADDTNYVQIPLQFKFVEMDGELDSSSQLVEEAQIKDLYLSDILIQNSWKNSAAKQDLSAAIRVHFDAFATGDEDVDNAHTNRLVSKNGGDTLTCGALDLDSVPGNDKTYTEAEKGAMYGFGDESFIANAGSEIKYGVVPSVADADNKQISYAASNVNGIGLLGSTSDVDGKYLNVKVTIWLEGWQTLPNSNNEESSMWDFLKTIDSEFNVGMQFEARDHQ